MIEDAEPLARPLKIIGVEMDQMPSYFFQPPKENRRFNAAS